MSLQPRYDEEILTRLKKIWGKWENLEIPDPVWNKLRENFQKAEKALSKLVFQNMEAKILNWKDAGFTKIGIDPLQKRWEFIDHLLSTGEILTP